MASTPALPSLSAAAAPGAQGGQLARGATGQLATAAVATRFEAVFLNTMFQQMFTAIDGEGPFGGGAGTGVWRSFLAEEYANSFARAGGVGIGKEVQRMLLEIQEAAAR